MDIDIGNLIYIVFVALIILVNLFTKGKKKNRPPGPENQNPDTVGPAPVDPRKSFEELLEEFTRPQQETPPPPPPPKPKPIPQPVPRAEPIRQHKPQPVKKKEHSIMKTEYARFEEFKRNEHHASKYARAFKDIDSAKKAFVFSEIFKRKY